MKLPAYANKQANFPAMYERILVGEMVGFARGVAPEVEWREGDAAALPTGPSEAFDVVTCQQGLQFFPDRAAAAREMARALAPRGRLAVAVWRSLDENPLFAETHRVGERHAGPIRDQRHAFDDPDVLAALLRDAGLADVRVEAVSRTLRFPDGASLLKMNAMALVGMSARSSTLSAEDRARLVDAIAAESAEATRRFADGDALAFETRSNLAIASR